MPRDIARRVLELEARAILDLVPRLDGSFDRAASARGNASAGSRPAARSSGGGGGRRR